MSSEHQEEFFLMLQCCARIVWRFPPKTYKQPVEPSDVVRRCGNSPGFTTFDMPIEESKEEPVKDFFTTVKVSHLDQPQPSLIRPHRSTRATSWRNRRVARDSLKSGLNPLLKPLENRDLPSHPPIAYCE